MRKQKLTRAQNNAWQFVLGYFGKFGSIPSAGEMGECLEMTRQGVYSVMTRLLAKGYLVRNKSGEFKIKN